MTDKPATQTTGTPTWQGLEPYVENVLIAYRAKFGNRSTEGVRRNAPMQSEMAELASALNDIRTGKYQGRTP